jgi:hypothetical protein
MDMNTNSYTAVLADIGQICHINATINKVR